MSRIKFNLDGTESWANDKPRMHKIIHPTKKNNLIRLSPNKFSSEPQLKNGKQKELENFASDNGDNDRLAHIKRIYILTRVIHT